MSANGLVDPIQEVARDASKSANAEKEGAEVQDEPGVKVYPDVEGGLPKAANIVLRRSLN